MQHEKFGIDEEGTLDTVEYTLINLVRASPELYNSQDPGYRDKVRKDLAWEAIARQLNKDEIWCYSKWRNLVDYYKSRKKIYDNVGSRGTRWVYYDALSFLDLCESSNRDNNSDHSQSSIRSVHDQLFEDGSNNQNYFNETQYHSLDGITERAAVIGAIRDRDEPRLNQLPDPLSDYCPPLKRQRGPGPSVRVAFPLSSMPASSATSSSTRNIFSAEPDDGGSGVKNEAPLMKITKVRSNKELMPMSACQQLSLPSISAPISNPDPECPHYHFCMSLASRFRKMDEGTATYVQMKIMEVLLKAQFPEEYKKRRSEN